MKYDNDEDRILLNIKKDDTTKCWEWLGYVYKSGYGGVTFEGQRLEAHRLSYWLFVGNPDGWHIDHICRNRSCVNPDHLRLVTQADNNRYAAGWNYKEGSWYCKRNHLVEGYNAMPQSLGRSGVQCRACQRLYKI